MLLRVTYVYEGNDTITFSLPKDTNPMIGRDQSANDIVLHDSRVSRIHARITRRGKQMILQDLGSRTGTEVNCKIVADPTPVLPTDTISVGAHSFRVELVEWSYDTDTEATIGFHMATCSNPDCRMRVPQGFAACLGCGTELK